MSVETQVYEALFAAIREINDQLPPNQSIMADKATLLSSIEGEFNSLTQVNLIVTAEHKIKEAFNISISLADERAMSQKISPFQSVESLANYIVMLVKEKTK